MLRHLLRVVLGSVHACSAWATRAHASKLHGGAAEHKLTPHRAPLVHRLGVIRVNLRVQRLDALLLGLNLRERGESRREFRLAVRALRVNVTAASRKRCSSC